MASSATPAQRKYPTARGKWRIRAWCLPDRGEQTDDSTIPTTVRHYWRFESWDGGRGAAGNKWTPRPAGWFSEAEIDAEVSRLFTSGEWREKRPAPAAPVGPPVVFWQLTERWIAHRQTDELLAARTQRASRGRTEGLVYRRVGRDLESWVARPLAAVRLSLLGHAHVDAYVQARLREPSTDGRRKGETISVATISRELSELGMMLRWGQGQGWVTCREGLLPYLSQVRKTLGARRHEQTVPKLTPDAETVAAVLDDLTTRRPWARMGLLIQYITGCRTGEAGSLTRERVRWLSKADGDEDDGVLILLKGKNRRKYPGGLRPILVLQADAPRFLAELRGWMDDHPGPPDETVLGVSDSTYRAHSTTYLKQACAAVGTPYWTPTGLRRAASVALIEAGLDLLSYQRRMDHSFDVAEQAYLEATRKHDRRASHASRDTPAVGVAYLDDYRNRAQKSGHTDN